MKEEKTIRGAGRLSFLGWDATRSIWSLSKDLKSKSQELRCLSPNPSTCAVCVGDYRGSWLGSVCPRPQDWGRDPLPLLSEPGHPKLILRGRTKVGHCSPTEEKLYSWFSASVKISTSPCYFGTHEGHWRYRLTEASCLCWKNSCKMCLIVVRERVNINLTWAWAYWLLDVNPAVVKVW